MQLKQASIAESKVRAEASLADFLTIVQTELESSQRELERREAATREKLRNLRMEIARKQSEVWWHKHFFFTL